MPSKKTIKLAAFVPLVLLASAAISATPVHAYGQSQWEIGFSFTCHASGSPCDGLGFWGWCRFGGSAADGQSGTSGDCQITNYNFKGALGIPTFNPFHVNQDISKWHIATGSQILPPNTPSFFATAGTAEFTGPGAGDVNLPTATPIDFVPLCTHGLFFLCDTGIPAAPGHYDLSNIPLFGLSEQPGIHYNLQVNHIPA